MDASLPLPRGWTPKQIKRWLALRAAGKSNAQIAKAMGHPIGTINKLLTRMRRLGHDIPQAETNVRLFSDGERALIRALAMEGLPPKAIAERIRSDLGVDRAVSSVGMSAYYREARQELRRQEEELRASLPQPAAGVVTHRIVADRIVPVMQWEEDCMGAPLSKSVTLPRLSILSERAA